MRRLSNDEREKETPREDKKHSSALVVVYVSGVLGSIDRAIMLCCEEDENRILYLLKAFFSRGERKAPQKEKARKMTTTNASKTREEGVPLF